MMSVVICCICLSMLRGFFVFLFCLVGLVLGGFVCSLFGVFCLGFI